MLGRGALRWLALCNKIPKYRYRRDRALEFCLLNIILVILAMGEFFLAVGKGFGNVFGFDEV